MTSARVDRGDARGPSGATIPPWDREPAGVDESSGWRRIILRMRRLRAIQRWCARTSIGRSTA
jgi:hypothetical protein